MLTNSKQPRKQRKARFTAPLHKLHHLVNVHLSKEAKGKLKTTRRCIAVKKGDRVKIMVGENRGKIGKVTGVDLKGTKVFVEGIVRKKSKGGEAMVPIDPSKLLILEAVLDDYRKKLLDKTVKIA
jgi:large subunit ribosomal protein L24